MTAATEAKGRRLFMAGNVEHLEDAQAFFVQGDHGRYLVLVDRDESYCSCRAAVECSHRRAAELHLQAARASAACVPAHGPRESNPCASRQALAAVATDGVIPLRGGEGRAGSETSGGGRCERTASETTTGGDPAWPSRA